MVHLATYFDKNYLNRGLVLYDSLKEQCRDFEIYVLCLDEITYNYFYSNPAAFPEVKPIQLSALEENDAQLLACKSNRSVIEYYFTLSPCLPLYLLKKYRLPHICTLDADILFLSSPQSLFQYLEEFSVVITPHKFSPEMVFLERYGKYNVSFQVFKNDETGLTCLQRWREQCIDWCGDYFDEQQNRFADQKYLDEWNVLYPGKVKELYDDVSGLAPWNLNHYSIVEKNGNFYSNNQRIIFYHFHHFKLLGKRWASNGLKNYEAREQKAIDELYLDYWNRIEEKNNLLGNTAEISQRKDLARRLPVKLFNELCIYFKTSRHKIIRINMNRFPNIVKRIILRLYA